MSKVLDGIDTLINTIKGSMKETAMLGKSPVCACKVGGKAVILSNNLSKQATDRLFLSDDTVLAYVKAVYSSDKSIAKEHWVSSMYGKYTRLSDNSYFDNKCIMFLPDVLTPKGREALNALVKLNPTGIVYDFKIKEE